MQTISYIPSRDEILLRLSPLRNKKFKKVGNFTLWYDEQNNICGIGIESYSKEIENLRKNSNIIKLGGIWKGIKITDKDIRKARRELVKKLERKW
jgi:hypothetical protein